MSVPETKVCLGPGCGAVITRTPGMKSSKWKSKRYCTHTCYAKSMKQPLNLGRICGGCDKPLVPHDGETSCGFNKREYCSRVCCGKAAGKRHAKTNIHSIRSPKPQTPNAWQAAHGAAGAAGRRRKQARSIPPIPPDQERALIQAYIASGKVQRIELPPAPPMGLPVYPTGKRAWRG